MSVDRPRAEEEAGGDLFGGRPRGDEARDLQLVVGERCGALRAAGDRLLAGRTQLPGRASREHGYKQYRVHHLVALVRIRRLVALGLPRARIRGPQDPAPEALHAVAAELEADIARLTRVRAEVAAILRERAPVYSPPGFEHVAARLTEVDRVFVHLCIRLCSADRVDELARMIDAESEAVRRTFDALARDADDLSRQRLVHAMEESGVNWRAAAVQGRRARALADALRELYNPAQYDVIRRGAALAAAA